MSRGAPWRELLPTSVEIGGIDYEIRSDYRAVLDICTALSDPELGDEEKAMVALDIFYPAFEVMPPEHYQEAINRCFAFIDAEEERPQAQKSPKLMDWKQDFKYIVAPVNRVLGQEVRSLDYLHWWTFLSAYYEIGECLFTQIVKIREYKATGKQLDKQDREWYRKNRYLVDMRTTYTGQDDEALKQWLGQ